MTEKFDVAVLGTGLFGAALAYHLAQEPSLRVIAIDAERAPRRPSATEASAGILSVQGWDPWDLAVVRESTEQYVALAEREGAPLVRRDGGLRVARTEAGVRWLERVRRVLEREGVAARRVGPGEIREILPHVDLSDVRDGCFTPDDATVDPAALRTGYLGAAGRAGVMICAAEEGIRPERLPPGTWNVGTEPAREARALVVASGAWSKGVLRALGHPLPLAPFRAQAVRLRPRPLVPPFPTLHDLDLDLYVRSAPGGRVLAGDGTGATEADPARWAATADPSFVRRMETSVGSLLGGLAADPVEAAWAGLCTASPDRFPLVGRVPGDDGLYVATGFNGLGAMRAGGLARRLAGAIGSGRWESLRPVDPRRFPGPGRPFEPRPEFPLESEDEDPAPPRDPDARPLRPAAERRGDATIGFRRLATLGEVDRLRWAPLSEWFDPFLPTFARDALRTGGSVEVAEVDGVVRGLLLTGASEGVGSGFTRTRSIAERYLAGIEPPGLYLEAPWAPGGEPVEIFAADLRDWVPREGIRHPVRIATPEDLGPIRSLMRELLGPGVDPWIATLPRPEESGFLCELDGRAVGVSWLTRRGPYARGHSFLVHPRYRGIGIGSDLLTARMHWLRRTGGRQVVSEIYDGNVASRTAAERAGMARVGQLFHFVRSPRARPPATSGGPRSSGSSWPSNPSASRSTGTGP